MVQVELANSDTVELVDSGSSGKWGWRTVMLVELYSGAGDKRTGGGDGDGRVR